MRPCLATLWRRLQLKSVFDSISKRFQNQNEAKTFSKPKPLAHWEGMYTASHVTRYVPADRAESPGAASHVTRYV